MDIPVHTAMIGNKDKMFLTVIILLNRSILKYGNTIFFASVYFNYIRALIQDKNQLQTDQELLDAFYKEKDNHLLGPLLQRYTLLLLGVSMKYLKNEMEARDAVQQVFMKVIQELQHTQVTYFKSWLYMIVKNHCLMQIRDRQSKPYILDANDIQISEEPFNREIHLDKEKKLVYLQESLDVLNADQKICIHLFYIEKKSYKEISDSTGFSMLQVKSFIQNGKRNLKILVEKKQQDEPRRIQ